MIAHATRGPEAINDLVWYFRDAPAALGFSAQVITDCPIESSVAAGFTAEQIAAAAKQAQIRAVLRLMTPEHQAVLECAYSVRNWAATETSVWGVAEGAVVRARHSCVDAEKAAKYVYDHARRQRRAANRPEDVDYWDGEQKRTRALLGEHQRLADRAAEDTLVLVERAHRAYLAIRTRHRAEAQQDKRRRLHAVQAEQVAKLELRTRAKANRRIGSKVRERVLWVADMVRDIIGRGGVAA